jgi:hypothetical protein
MPTASTMLVGETTALPVPPSARRRSSPNASIAVPAVFADPADGACCATVERTRVPSGSPLAVGAGFGADDGVDGPDGAADAEAGVDDGAAEPDGADADGADADGADADGPDADTQPDTVTTTAIADASAFSMARLLERRSGPATLP